MSSANEKIFTFLNTVTSYSSHSMIFNLFSAKELDDHELPETTAIYLFTSVT